MHYYISYISRGQHAMLVLTQHLPPRNPEIVADLGFAPMEYIPSRIQKIRGVKGDIRAEDIASVLAYSQRTIARNKTWQISNKEAATFLHKVKLFAAQEGEEISKAKPAVKDYRLLSYNCKVFALETLKEMGIIRHELADLFIQDPAGNIDSALDIINPGDIFCPQKDKLIENLMLINSQYEILKKYCESIQNNEQIKNLRDFCDSQISDIKNFIKEIKKSDFLDRNISTKYKKIQSSSVYEKNNLLNTLTKNYYDKETIKELAVLFKDVNKLFDTKLCVYRRFEYFWQKLPKITPRFDLANLDLYDLALLDINIRRQETFEFINNSLELIDSYPPSEQGSFLEIKNILLNAEKEHAEFQEDFKYILKKRRDENINKTHLEKALECIPKLDNILNSVKTQIKEVRTSEPKVNFFKKLLLRFIDFIKHSNKRMFKIDSKSVLLNKLDKIKNAQRKGFK